MNNLPFDILVHIFRYIKDPGPWSGVNRVFCEVSKHPGSIALWALTHYDPWRAFDHMIEHHAKILTPAVANCMLADGARLPRWFVQAVLLRITELRFLPLDTLLFLLTSAKERHGPWEVGQQDTETVRKMCTEIFRIDAGTRSVPVPEELTQKLDELLRRTQFYPIESTFYPKPGPTHLHYLAWLVLYARPYMEELIKVHNFPILEFSTSRTLNDFSRRFVIDDPLRILSSRHLAILVQFLLDHRILVATPDDIHNIFEERADTRSRIAVLKVTKLVHFPFPLAPLAHAYLAHVIAESFMDRHDNYYTVIAEIYRSWPDQELLARSLTLRRAAFPHRHAPMDLPPPLLLYFACELGPRHPEGQLIFNAFVTEIATPLLRQPHWDWTLKENLYWDPTFMVRFVREGEFRFQEQHFDLIAAKAAVNDVREFAFLVYRLGYPVTVTTAEGVIEDKCRPYLKKWLRKRRDVQPKKPRDEPGFVALFEPEGKDESRKWRWSRA